MPPGTLRTLPATTRFAPRACSACSALVTRACSTLPGGSTDERSLVPLERCQARADEVERAVGRGCQSGFAADRAEGQHRDVASRPAADAGRSAVATRSGRCDAREGTQCGERDERDERQGDEPARDAGAGPAAGGARRRPATESASRRGARAAAAGRARGRASRRSARPGPSRGSGPRSASAPAAGIARVEASRSAPARPR